MLGRGRKLRTACCCCCCCCDPTCRETPYCSPSCTAPPAISSLLSGTRRILLANAELLKQTGEHFFDINGASNPAQRPRRRP